MPNRMIKDSFRTSDKVNALTDFQFRLWVSLITYVDDYGRGDARAAVIKGSCFPLREKVTVKDINAALAALAATGCIGLYEADGRPYLYFPNWERHQTIRNKRSKYPEPTSDSNLQTIENNCIQLRANVPVIQSNPIRIQSEYERERRFAPPSLEEVTEFVRENGLECDPEAFYDYYQGNGWRVGKNKMKDWQAAVRSWARREAEFGKKPKKPKEIHVLDDTDRDYACL